MLIYIKRNDEEAGELGLPTLKGLQQLVVSSKPYMIMSRSCWEQMR
jgi:hypothetical protein